MKVEKSGVFVLLTAKAGSRNTAGLPFACPELFSGLLLFNQIHGYGQTNLFIGAGFDSCLCRRRFLKVSI
jgi:hypothetical protein